MFAIRQQGIVDVICGEGPLATDTLETLQPLLQQCLSRVQPRAVIDLADVPYIDSSGLEWLLDATDRFAERGGMLHVANPNSLCRDILRITGVGTNLDLFDEVTQAVGSFSR